MGNYYECFSLRLPDATKEKVRIIAKIDRRSINQEIVYLVEAYIQKYEAEHGEIEVDA